MKYPYIYECVSSLRPANIKNWNKFLVQVTNAQIHKAGSVFEVDEKNKRVVIRRWSTPVKDI